jgi:hypothetical protein
LARARGRWFDICSNEIFMPKTVKKAAAKKSAAQPAKKKTAVKKTAPKKTARPASVRTKAVSATPARVMSKRRGGKSEITAVIGSVTTEDISLRAYFIGEDRRHRGLPGNPEADWLEAERQLRG